MCAVYPPRFGACSLVCSLACSFVFFRPKVVTGTTESSYKMPVGPSQGPVKATRSPTKAGKSEGIKNLIGAAENGDLATLRLLLEQGVRVTSANRVRTAQSANTLDIAISRPRPHTKAVHIDTPTLCVCTLRSA